MKIKVVFDPWRFVVTPCIVFVNKSGAILPHKFALGVAFAFWNFSLRWGNRE